MERTGYELAHLGRGRIEVRQLAISGDREVDAHEVRTAVAVRSPDPLQRAVVAGLCRQRDYLCDLPVPLRIGDARSKRALTRVTDDAAREDVVLE